MRCLAKDVNGEKRVGISMSLEEAYVLKAILGNFALGCDKVGRAGKIWKVLYESLNELGVDEGSTRTYSKLFPGAYNFDRAALEIEDFKDEIQAMEKKIKFDTIVEGS